PSAALLAFHQVRDFSVGGAGTAFPHDCHGEDTQEQGCATEEAPAQDIGHDIQGQYPIPFSSVVHQQCSGECSAARTLRFGTCVRARRIPPTPCSAGDAAPGWSAPM